MKFLAMAMALLVSATCAMPATARDRWRDQQQQQQAPAQDGSMSADEAARRAQQQYGGRVLAVRPEGPGFRVKMLKDGEVRSVYVGP
jgi:hypothetical protein